jgi:FixJ family two-component response regulator
LQNETNILIYVVDDDASVRKALKMLFVSAGMEARAFQSAEDFLRCNPRQDNTCLITDIKMKGMSGIELQRRLARQGSKMPVIFLTAVASKANREQAKQAGAYGYFRKPVDDQALLDTIHLALSPGWVEA